MNNINEIMLEFIRGGISREDENDLFIKLAQDDELRQEFKTFSAVEKSLKSTNKSFIPPEEMSNSIFNQIGVPLQIPKSSAFLGGFMGSKFFGYLFTAAIALVTGFLLYPIINGTGGNTENTQHEILQKAVNIINNENTNQNKKIGSAEDLVTRNISKINKKNVQLHDANEHPQQELDNNSTLAHEDYTLHTSESSTAVEENAEANDLQVETIEEVERVENIVDKNVIYEDLSANNEIPAMQIAPLSSAMPSSNSDFVFEFNHSAVWNMPQAEIAPSEYAPFHNTSLAVYYKLNSLFKIGAKVRQESFYLLYSGTENEKSFDYKQQPNYTSLSAQLRVSPIEFAFIKPFGELGFGINRGGNLLRTSLGAEISIYPNVSFILAGEYAYFRYLHQSAWFDASKLSLNYGILINF